MKVDPCAVACLLVVLKGINFGCRIFISFQVGMLMIFDSNPEFNKNLFQGLVFEIVCISDFLKKVGLSRFFLFVTALLQI